MDVVLLVLVGAGVALGMIAGLAVRATRRRSRRGHLPALPTWGGVYRETLASECNKPRYVRRVSSATAGPLEVVRARYERSLAAASGELAGVTPPPREPAHSGKSE